MTAEDTPVPPDRWPGFRFAQLAWKDPRLESLRQRPPQEFSANRKRERTIEKDHLSAADRAQLICAMRVVTSEDPMDGADK
eukprot:scaffold1220_cov259-Pinguiococcus_pyrenoidosus.AAC.28